MLGKLIAMFLIVIGIGLIGFAAVWSDSDKPKSYPDLAKWRLAKAEEMLRNCDPNSFEYMVAKKSAAQLNKYVREFRCDVNKDGIVDANDVKLVTDNLGNSGKGLSLSEL